MEDSCGSPFFCSGMMGCYVAYMLLSAVTYLIVLES